MKMSDLNTLTMDNIGTWPIPVKVVTIVHDGAQIDRHPNGDA